jgi:tryptophan 2,3-dioxygenase
MKYEPIHYHDYLKLGPLLNLQERRSQNLGRPAHDEMLFITVHQTYELWFKQILFELQMVQNVFSQGTIEEREMGRAVHHLERIGKIQNFINGQIAVLESMTPMDFLEFRDMLYPASGFQSVQWRLIETLLGLKSESRQNYNQEPFWKSLTPELQVEIEKALKAPSLFDLLEKWLERTPFQSVFWQQFEKALLDLFEEDRKAVNMNPRLSDSDKARNFEIIETNLKNMRALFHEQDFKILHEDGFFRMSQKAILAALFIQIYRDEPIFQMPFRLLQSLLDIDEAMTQWRSRHVQMVHRMLGRKIGTGGSSGHQYLAATVDKHKIFTDLFNLTTFLLPRSRVPSLPPEIQKKMSYRLE